MQVAGVDFGTTNVRIATWDSSDPDVPPRSLFIGQGDASAVMPAVIAFQRQAGGAVSTVVGEGADILDDGPSTLVVRNIKRWALSSDPFVRWHLESGNTPFPPWWNPETRCIEAWGQEIPVQEAMRQILDEAFRRAQRVGLSGEFEWRAGCPVHAGLDYRSELAQVLAEFGGNNKVASVIEEPILFLLLAHRRQRLEPGSYMVYDMGGGSFDCAIAEVESTGRMTVYASHGDPLLGGVAIDEQLRDKLDYNGRPDRLRTAKERLTPQGPDQPVDDDTSLSWTDLEEVLKKSMFFDRTLVAMREAYISAKVIWKRDEQASPMGDGIPSLRLGNVPTAFANDLNAIILYGGPTKSPIFTRDLALKFGAERIISTGDLVPAEIPDPELTSLSMGACYAFSESHTPLYIRRLPARITLRNTRTRDSVAYEPYQHFVSNFSPARPFVSSRLPEAGPSAKYQLTITDPDGVVLRTKAVDFDRSRAPRASARSPRLVIDMLGQIGIDEDGSRWVEIGDTPWQTQNQRMTQQAILERRREFERTERERIHREVNRSPFLDVN